jgi:hypothetical protein
MSEQVTPGLEEPEQCPVDRVPRREPVVVPLLVPQAAVAVEKRIQPVDEQTSSGR